VVSRRSNHYRLTGRYGFFRRTIRREFDLCRVRRHGWPPEGKTVLGHGWAGHRRAQRGIFRVGQKPCSIVAEASLWKNTTKVGDDGVGEVHIGSDSPGLLYCVSTAACLSFGAQYDVIISCPVNIKYTGSVYLVHCETDECAAKTLRFNKRFEWLQWCRDGVITIDLTGRYGFFRRKSSPCATALSSLNCT